MAVKPPHPSFVSPSSLNPCCSRVSAGTCFSFKSAAHLDYLIGNCCYKRNKYLMRPAFFDISNSSSNRQLFASSKNLHTSQRIGKKFLLASPEDGLTVNGNSHTSAGNNVEEMRIMLTESLQKEDHCDMVVQYLHDAARNFELAIKGQKSFPKLAWFSAAWLGVDRNAWMKKLSYQASVYSLLQAACQISSRGEDRDRDINVFVQRSLLRQTSPLENHIREEVSSKQSEAYDWLCSEQVPTIVTSFINYFEEDRRFIAVTSTFGRGKSSDTGNESEILLLMLALTCIAAITKLGPAKVSSLPFFSMIPETTGRLLDKLADFVLVPQLYQAVKSIGLHREFLVHFGPRIATCRVQNDKASDEVVFWVDLLQKQLQRAIDREKIWSKLTTSESIEVLERDLAIFGFFIALGRSTQYFLSANGFDSLDDPIEDFVRYLIGGSVLFYPQLSSISSFQIYVEVVSEELEWLPFYPGITATTSPKQSHGHKSKRPPNFEAIPQVLHVCSHWLKSYIKYSKWLENPSSVKAARFLSRGHNNLILCLEELGISKMPVAELSSIGMNVSLTGKGSNSFDKALENVDEALIRLEKLLKQLHVSSSYSGKEQLKAACTNLEKIRKLKKEAELLEASFRAKTASLQESPAEEKLQYLKEETKRSNRNILDRGNRFGKNLGMWSFFMRLLANKTNPEPLRKDYIEQPTTNIDDSEQNEVRRFELLRNELIELEKRVQRSADQSENVEERSIGNLSGSNNVAGGKQLVKAQTKENFIKKTLDKLKETSTDVWQGTQLLAIDATAAVELLRRSLIGHQLTEKEKKALRRTMTDLASVVPIGILMLLPVTAVGHAAMLAAIQRYVPALIPSTYGPERLNLLRQLEKVKGMQSNESDSEDNATNYPESKHQT